MSSEPTDSREYFDEVAGQWESMRAGFFSEDVRERALAAAGVRAGDRVADIGAGSGFLTEGLVAAGASVVAVDQSAAMLDALRARFPDATVEVKVGSSEALPLDDGSVDHALANMYLHHVERPAQAIAEMARALRPGGSLVITDLDSHDFEFLREEHHDRWMGFERADVRAWFEAAGLVEVRVEDAGSNCQADSECGTQRADVRIWLACGRKPVT